MWEKEEDRKHDSFRAFEEILQLAQQHDVDMLLLGGDLFHDNKPSRTTINRTIELMNKYCLGDRPVQIQVLNSNQADIFVNGWVCVVSSRGLLGAQLPCAGQHRQYSSQYCSNQPQVQSCSWAATGRVDGHPPPDPTTACASPSAYS